MATRVEEINKAASTWIYRPVYTWARRLRYSREFHQYVVRWMSGQSMSTADGLERDLIWKLHCFAEDTRAEQNRLIADPELTAADASFPDFDTYVPPELPDFWVEGISQSRVHGLTAALSERPTTTQVNGLIQDVVGAAPEALNTLQELAAELEGSETALDAIVATVGTKADASVVAALEASLAPVATSGDYNDLINPPVFATVATSGSYNDLLNKPTTLNWIGEGLVPAITPFPRKVWENLIDVTVGNTTTETTLIAGTGQGSITIPANFLQAGATFTLEARGTYNTGIISALLGSLTIRAKIDGTVMGVATLNMTNFAASMTNKGWSGRGDTVFRAITGNNISANTAGQINYIGAGVTAITEEFINNNANVDRTVQHTLNITAQFSSAQPANSIRVTQLRFWYTPPIP
jgi:hypothetical protein